MHTISIKLALALALSTGTAALLVAIGPVGEPGASFSQTRAAGSRCAWQIDPYRVRGDLYGVTAIKRRDVWAVGITEDGQPLALHWLGAGWGKVDVPMKQGPDLLNAVAFVNANDGWAVGRGDPSDAIEHWDGVRWTVVPGADLGERSVFLQDVAAPRKGDAWAVGLTGPVSGRTLAEHWDGTRWTLVPTPDVGQSQFGSVAAISHNNVWAVGNRLNNTLIEHWNGTRWKVLPDPAAPRGGLADIAAVSARDIWVVGSQGPPAPARWRPLIEHWDGKKWSVVPSPINHRGSLESVAAVSARDIWISGGSPESSTVFLAHRIRTRWRMVRAPHIKGELDLLIAAAGKDDVWGIESVANFSDTRPRIEHYRCRS